MNTYRSMTSRRRGTIGQAPEALEDRRLMTYGAARFVTGTPIAFDLAPQTAVLADFNLDGNLDLATFTRTSTVVGVALGKGNGAFRAPQYLPSPSNLNVTGLVVGDFNNDGKPDLAMTTYNYSNGDTPLGVLINTSASGGALSFAPVTTVDAGWRVRCLTAGDFNGDGKLDVAVGYADDSLNGIGVILGHGDGTFQPVMKSYFLQNFVSLGTADFNHDGKLDLTATYFNRSDVYPRPPVVYKAGVLLGDGTGSFQDMTDLDVGTSVTSLAVGDFNRDGALDIAAASAVSFGGYTSAGTNQATVLLGDGAGAFTKQATIPFASAATAVATADFNGDGRLDLAVLTPADDSLTVLYGDGRGGLVKFRPRQSVFPVDADASSNSIAVGRVANRTLPDVVVAAGSSGHVNVMLNRSRFSRPLRRHR
ncbi:FG-GAP repeat domain-containing protein [Paludisphaera rhizosphaerae]|uniref:FG-GAP repeat domain-containing protein n=1 Tax=Paludisphaera rhizosphaerae TaxID=2711216 RepID=UPI0013ED24B1|nr:VCBS repeat-containing protein [Paludisphaera rhizosphaerae]